MRKGLHVFASASVTLALAVTGCGDPSSNPSTSNQTVSGTAAADAPIVGTVFLKDSSVPALEKTTATNADGTFSFDVTGLTAPYLLKAGSEASWQYSASTGSGTANINPLTTTAVAGTASGTDLEELYQAPSPTLRRTSAHDFPSFMNQLATVLAPLFQEFGISASTLDDGSQTSQTALRALFQAVAITVKGKMVTVTNRQTGGVIFTGSLSDLAAGTFNAANMPPDPGTTTPPPTACTYAYSAWGACQADNTQTRTVTSSSPSGCTGTPVLSQACTYVPPPPAACTYTYSTWGACQSNNTQTRTVTSSSPAGCTGTPVLSQACTYVPPPPAACTYTYSAWGACQSNNTQTRTVTSSSPAGCTGTPFLSQACTYVPPPPAACTYTYSTWGACQSNNTQTRTVTSSSPSGCTGTPVLTQVCTYVPPPPAACTYSYSAWGACQSNNTQTRTVTSSSPAGCTGTPILSQACTYTPPAPDGAALYASSCAGCHGPLASSNLKGKNISVSLIQSMGMTQGLTTTQLQAIVTAVGP